MFLNLLLLGIPLFAFYCLRHVGKYIGTVNPGHGNFFTLKNSIILRNSALAHHAKYHS